MKNCAHSAGEQQHPKLSIITPSFNQGEFLEATIQSVLRQKYPNLEYIVIDGGSTDNSVEIILRYEGSLAYWVSEKDGGQTDAINKGLEKSTGEILGWVNSDDVYIRGAFQKIVRAFQSHPEHIVVHGDRILLDRAGKVIGWSCYPEFEPLKYGYEHGYTVASETAFWRRSAMQEAGVLKPGLRFAMDVEFFCRLYKHGRFLKLSDYLGGLRCHDDSKSATIAHVGREESLREWMRLFGTYEGAAGAVLDRPPRVSRLRHYSRLLRHPFLIGLPYLSAKLFRRVSDKAAGFHSDTNEVH